MKLYEAQQMARRILSEMHPYCQRGQIAGSIRRLKPDVNDIEIVCVPKWGQCKAGLFAEDMTRENLLHRDWGSTHPSIRWIKTGTDQIVDWVIDPDGKYWRALLPSGVKLDLFLTTPEQWGIVFLIRTGSADFSRTFVTKRSQFGWMPDDMKVADGFLWKNGMKIPTPEEIDVFNAIGKDWVPPEKRV